MKKRIAIGLGLASLLVSGLTLFSVLGHADEPAIQTFTVQVADQPPATTQIRNVQVDYASLKVDVDGYMVSGQGQVHQVFILLSAPHIAEAAGKLFNEEKPNLIFLFYPLTQARFGTISSNAVFEKGRMHIDARDVLIVKSSGEKSNLLAEASAERRPADKIEQANDVGFIASVKAFFTDSRGTSKPVPRDYFNTRK